MATKDIHGHALAVDDGVIINAGTICFAWGRIVAIEDECLQVMLYPRGHLVKTGNTERHVLKMLSRKHFIYRWQVYEDYKRGKVCP